MKITDIYSGNMTAKEKKKLRSRFRAVIQILFFCFIPSAYTAAFAGVKYIFTQLGAGSRIELTSFVIVLIVLCAYTIVFGRFFCGFACAFGSLGDGVHALYTAVCRKCRKKPVQLEAYVADKLSYLKYIVLVIIVIACFAGVYSKAQGTSPWDVFSMIHVGNFRLENYIPGIVILALLLVGMCVQERFFCRFFCPMGAVFSLLPVFPFFALHRNTENCVRGCSACSRRCPSGISLPKDGSSDMPCDCFQCQKCINICPKENIHCRIRKIRGDEFWFTVLRAVILLALFLRLGI